MKFYFCEGCGQRITEKDIAAGTARDKKLKGVYCKNCAEGVTTMTTLPMTDEEAQKIAQGEKPAAGDTARRRAARRTSSGSRTLPPSARLRPSGKRDSAARIEPTGSKQVPLMIGGATLAVALVLVVVFAGGSSQRQPTATTKSKARNTAKRSTSDRGFEGKVERGQIPGKKTSTKTTSKKTPDPVGPTTRTPAPSSDELARNAFAQLTTQLAGMGANERARKISALESFLKQHKFTPSGREAQTQLDELITFPATTPTTPDGKTVQAGLVGSYYRGDKVDETNLALRRVDATVMFEWRTGSPGRGVPADAFCVRWYGWIYVGKRARYTFRVVKDDAVDLRINGRLVVGSQKKPPSEAAGSVTLQKGLHALLIDYKEEYGGARCQLFWSMNGGFSDRPVPAGVLFHSVGPGGDLVAGPKAKTLAPPPPKSTDKLEYEKLYAEATTLLARADVDAGLSKLEKARKDPKLKAFNDALGKDIQLAQSLKELEKAVEQGAATLAEKKPRITLERASGQKIETGPGTKGTITKVDGGVLTIEQSLGQGASAQHKWKLTELAPKTRTALMQMGLKELPDSQIKVAYSQFLALYNGAGDLTPEVLQKRIDAAQTAGSSKDLCTHLQTRLKAWDRERKAVVDIKTLTDKVGARAWDEVPVLIDRCRKLYAGTVALSKVWPKFEGWLREAADWSLKKPGPVTDAWVIAVEAMSPVEQIRLVKAKLKELNPKAAVERLQHRTENDRVVRIKLGGGWLNDIAPLRALKGLRILDFDVLHGHEGKLDLSALKDLPEVRTLKAYNTRVRDISPLRGSKIHTLNVASCGIKDWTPLIEMEHLKKLVAGIKPSPETGKIVRQTKALERINKISKAEFLKKCE